ncbi:MAG: efflux RND transporter periplasmic adaptor subunit, partial [Lachnoanaerobaculum gingivalis]
KKANHATGPAAAKASQWDEEEFEDENSPVKKGDVLIKISSRDLEYQKQLRQSSLDSYIAKKEESDIGKLMATSPMEYISGLKSSLDTAKAAYEAAQTDYSAKQALFEAQSVSLIELETSRANFENAKSNYETASKRLDESNKYLQSLKAEGLSEKDISEKFYESTKKQIEAAIESEKTAIAQLEHQIEDCEVKAEYDGIISKIPAKDISMAVAGQELAVIDTNNNEYRLECSVLTDVIPYIKTGDEMKAEFNLRGVKKSFDGKISEIYDFATEEKSPLGLKEYRVKLVAVLDNAGDDILKNGYGVDAIFTLYKNDNAIAVPIGAVFAEDELDYVFKIENKTAKKTPVSIVYKSSTQAVISEGLKEDDKVIINADEEKLNDGSKVREKK